MRLPLLAGFISASTGAFAASTTLNGEKADCECAREIKNEDGGKGPAAFDPGTKTILLNQSLMKGLSTELQLQVFKHECTHCDQGRDEDVADAGGLLRTVKEHGKSAQKVARDVCAFIGNAPADNEGHSSGPQRCQNVTRLAQCLESLDGKSESCLQANMAQNSGGGNSSGSSPGGSSAGGPSQAYGAADGASPAEPPTPPGMLNPTQLAALGAAWMANEYPRTPSQSNSGAREQNPVDSRASAPPTASVSPNAPSAPSPSAPEMGSAGFLPAVPAAGEAKGQVYRTSSLAGAGPSPTRATGSNDEQSGKDGSETVLEATRSGGRNFSRSIAAVASSGYAGLVPAHVNAATGGKGSFPRSTSRDVSDRLGPELFKIMSTAYKQHCLRSSMANCPGN